MADADKRWTVLELLRWTTQHFESKGLDTARLDAECLLGFALGVDRVKLYMDFEKPVLAEERARFRELVKQRANERIPVAQLTGVKEFWSHNFKVTRDVLSPRPDTETLVQEALDRLPDRDGAYRVLDLGTGTGAIALVLSQERPKAHVIATEISSEALKIAAENADVLQVSERVTLLEGDLFGPLESEDRFDLIVSNPPYVAEADRASLAPELAHEPDLALFAGPDGLDVLRRIASEAGGWLKAGASVLAEFGAGQGASVMNLFEAAGFEDVQLVLDLARKERVVAARAAQDPVDASTR